MTRLTSCKAASKSLRSYRRRARPSGSVCANAECAQEKNKAATKIQPTLFILIILSKPSRRHTPHQMIAGAIRFYIDILPNYQSYGDFRLYCDFFVKLIGANLRVSTPSTFTGVPPSSVGINTHN